MTSETGVRAKSPIEQAQLQLGRVVLWVRPDGWQTRARRNAWAAMVADSRRRTDRSAVQDVQPCGGPQLAVRTAHR